MKKPLIIGLSTVAILSSCSRAAPAPTVTPAPTLSQSIEQAKQDLQTKTGITLPTLVPTTATSTPTGAITPSVTSTPLKEQEILLKDPSGGAASGIARSTFATNRYKLMILADLPELKAGEVYRAWLIKGDDNDPNKNIVSAGSVRATKAGFSLEYNNQTDLTGHTRLLITRNLTNKLDTQDTPVLTGTFQ